MSSTPKKPVKTVEVKSTRITALVRTRQEGMRTHQWVDFFSHTCPYDEVESNLRAAVKEFLLTPQGEEAIEDSCDDFNWGDAIAYVPDEIWAKHGLKINDIPPEVIEVRQDEILIPTREDNT